MMTQEERQRQLAEQLRKQQDRVAMLSQSALTPEQMAALAQVAGYDPDGKEAMLATMLRGGQDALYGDMPQGKQIGDIYVAPTWSENLNAAAQKVLGGYQMGQARREQGDIDGMRTAAATAQQQMDTEKSRVEQLAAAEKAAADTMDTQATAAHRDRQLKQAMQIAEDNRRARLSHATGAAPQPKRSNTIPKPFKLADGREVYVTMVDGVPVDIDTGEQVSMTGAAPMGDGSGGGDVLSPASEAAGLRELRNRIVQDLNPMISALDRYDATLAPYTLGGEKEREFGDIPGMGRMSGKGKTMGYIARAGENLQAALGGEDSVGDPEQIFAAARDIANMKIREGAGLSQTVAEIERLRAVLEGEFGTDPAVVRNAVDAVKSAMNDDIYTMKAGTHPQIVEVYSKAAGDRNVLERQFAKLKFKGDVDEADDELAAEEEEIYRKFPHLRPK